MRSKPWLRVLLIVLGVVGGAILALVLLVGFIFQKARQPARPGSAPVLTAAQLPPLPVFQEHEGFLFASLNLPGPPGESRTLGIYLPPNPGTRKLPCVVIAPAGTRLFHGIGVGEGDSPEHLPYVRAGYAVVTYSLDGELDEQKLDNNRAVQRAQSAFIAAEGGVNNGKSAITYALSRLHVDPKRIIVAGHSSAATVALQLAAADPRVTACIAYAPCTDLEARLSEALPLLELINPGARAFYTSRSPKNNLEKLRCPVFLFHARDDSNVPFSDSDRFVQALQRAGGKVTFATADTGDHYESMIREGIPAAQKWLAQRAW